MTLIDSPWLTTSDTLPQKRVISEAITLIGPNETPLLDALGGFDGAASKFRFANGLSTKVEWMEDSYLPYQGVTAGTALIDGVTIVIDDATLIKPGHLLKIADEIVWVSAVNVGTNTLTIVRAWGGSTAAALTNAEAYTIIGIAKLENDVYTSSPFTTMSNAFNYSQIYEETVAISGSAQDIPMASYGFTDPMTYHRNKAMIGLMQTMERNIHYGIRSANTGSTTVPRTFGGYKTFITTNIGSAIIALSSLVLADIEAALFPIYQNGGSSNLTMFVSPNQYKEIRSWLTADTRVIIQKSDNVIGEQLPSKIVTPWGNLTMIMSRWQPDNVLPIIDLQHAGMLTLRDWQEEDLPKLTDGFRRSILGEFTFCLKAEKLSALIRLS